MLIGFSVVVKLLLTVHIQNRQFIWGVRLCGDFGLVRLKPALWKYVTKRINSNTRYY